MFYRGHQHTYSLPRRNKRFVLYTRLIVQYIAERHESTVMLSTHYSFDVLSSRPSILAKSSSK